MNVPVNSAPAQIQQDHSTNPSLTDADVMEVRQALKSKDSIQDLLSD